MTATAPPPADGGDSAVASAVPAVAEGRGGLVAGLLRPAPAERLAVFRVLVGAYVAVWATVRIPAHVGHTGQAPGRWQPVGVLPWLDRPPPAWAVVAVAVATPALAAAVALGWRYRASAPLLAASLLAVTTLNSSWGQVFHTENLVVLHVLVLAATPAAADALAVGGRARTGFGAGAAPDGRYGWPVRLAAVLVAVAYVAAGVAKLRSAGLGWARGDVLRNLVAHDNLRKAVLGDTYSPFGVALARHAWPFPLLAALTLVLELGAGAALLSRRLRVAWATVAWLFHVGVLALMAIVFPYQLSGVAFAPFFGLEALAAPERPWRRARHERTEDRPGCARRPAVDPCRRAARPPT